MAITKEEVAEAVRAWCAAWHARDIQTIIAMEARAGGFGIRALARRDHAALGDEGYWWQRLERFLGQMDTYRLELKDLQTSVTGDIGLAGGCSLRSSRRRGDRPNEPGSASPWSSPRECEVGRCCCTTKTSSLLTTKGPTPGHSRWFLPPPKLDFIHFDRA